MPQLTFNAEVDDVEVSWSIESAVDVGIESFAGQDTVPELDCVESVHHRSDRRGRSHTVVHIREPYMHGPPGVVLRGGPASA